MVNGPLIKGSAKGAAVGTVIMPGVGTVVGGTVGGLVSAFSGGPTAQQHQANVGNGATIDARQIYEMIKNGPGTSSLQDGSEAAKELQQTHSDRANQIAALNKEMDAAWQGDSAQAAQGGAHPLQIWLDDSSQNLGTSSRYIAQQAQDFSVVDQKVQPLPENPPSMGFVDHINPWSDKDSEIEEYNKKGQQNVDAFNAYYQASAQNAAGMPQYNAWTGNPLATEPGGPGTGVGNGGAGGGGTGGVGGGGGGGGGVGNLPRVGADIPSAHLPGTGTGSGGTGSGGYDTPPGYTPPDWSDSTSTSGYTPPSTDYSGNFGPGTSSTFGPGGGGGAGAGGGFGGGAGLGMAAGFGPGGGAGSLSPGATSGAGGAGAGSGSGAFGAGGARAGAAGAAGRPGMSGMGGMRGGHGEGSEDEEHETKYMVSEDPNDLFGTDELTAPPVIGE